MASQEASSSTDAVARESLAKELAEYRPRRVHRYNDVNVLLLSWKDGDTAISSQADEVKTLFQEEFHYRVHEYKIPSRDSQRSLNLYVAQFIGCFGGGENLIVVHYGGHGTRSQPLETEFLWAAQVRDGSALDWSAIQPQFLGAECDVVLFLDCCHAGQAVRSKSRYKVELLAATDKDNFTPIGPGRWPSFTRVLIDEMTKMLSESQSVAISSLHRQMLRVESGLMKQPFYVCMSDSASLATIKLTRRPSTSSEESQTHLSSFPEGSSFLHLRLRLCRSLNANNAQTFLAWVTRDSPDFIGDIEIVDRVLTQAKTLDNLGQELIQPEREDKGLLLPFLSPDGQKKAYQLMTDLRRSMTISQGGAMTDLEAIHAIHKIRESSSALLDFIDSCVTALDADALLRLQAADLSEVRGLRDRILMRLTLIGDATSQEQPLRVDFEDQPRSGQKLRVGKRQGMPVLVEYIYYDKSEDGSYARASRQIARISALHAEEKSIAFRSFRGAGFSHEILHGPRFGMLYGIPEMRLGCSFLPLSKLFDRVKAVPLEVRFQLGHALCGALLHLHSIGWFHKAIKSENVLVFSKETSPSHTESTHSFWDISSPYLIGFDYSRPHNAETFSTVDFNPSNNLYRHPDRWGKSLRFERHHDLYALGILLTEVGFWRTLPSLYSKQGGFKAVEDPEKLRDFLVGSAHARLAHAAGARYADATRFCLERRDWGKYEDWQYQEEVRKRVWTPLQGQNGLRLLVTEKEQDESVPPEVEPLPNPESFANDEHY